MPSILIAAVEALSTLATVTLVYSTSKPCRESQAQYLLGVPVGFGLMAIAFATNTVISSLPTGMPGIGLLLGTVFALTQTYGVLFLALTYARRTRLRLIGESTSLEFAVPSLVTAGVLVYVLNQQLTLPSATPSSSMNISLRVVMAICSLYLVYETERSWSLTKRAGEVLVIVAFALFFIEQLGFILSDLNLGDVAVFLGYEGRVLGLVLLVAVTFVGIRKGDLTTVIKRLGLTAPAHDIPGTI
jgi:hypothetical protein